MNETENEELYQKFEAEIEQLETNGFRIALMLTPTQAVALVATIQLAMRHPNFRGAASITAFKFVRWIRQDLEFQAPFTAEVIRRGGLKEYDQPVKRHKKGGNHA
jgi:hypothetical protein